MRNEDPLLPERYPNGELFLCEVGDIALKDDTASMEHPFFVLSGRASKEPRHYESGDNTMTVTPSGLGHPTIQDKDILIYAISNIIHAKNQGRPYSKHVSFNASEFLMFANRSTDGKSYEGVRSALKRLKGVAIETNIKTGGLEQTRLFGLIEEAYIYKKLDDGTVVNWGITLSDWLFNAVESLEVLTISKDYFRLRKPIERRVYEIARKHCGHQSSWKVHLHTLHKKTGSQSSKKLFKQTMKKMAATNHLPDYSLRIDDQDYVEFLNLNYKPKVKSDFGLQLATWDMAKLNAPTWDVSYLETRWRNWLKDKGITGLTDPDTNFLSFCETWYEKHGNAS